MTELCPLDPAIDVTVCIVNWQGAQWLPDCLRSLREVEGLRLETILVDNASSDNSVEVVRNGFPEVEVISNPQNAGFARANNQAIRRGRGRHFFLLNNDTIVDKGSLENIVKFMEERPRAGMVAGHLVNHDGSTQFMYYPVALPTLASMTADLFWLNRNSNRNRIGRGPLARHWDPAKPYRMEQVPGACILVRREAFESFGLFDEGYRFWYEDVDLCARCLRAGWEIWYVPDARIVHYGGASAKQLGFSERSLLRFRSMLKFAERYLSRSHFVMLKLVVALVLILRLPLVVGASLWPSTRMKSVWKGAVKAYLQLMRELVHPVETRAL
jgi:N-acetylglucosaminyl-diphospho-decaprenol L-rhamnosyltransferase